MPRVPLDCALPHGVPCCVCLLSFPPLCAPTDATQGLTLAGLGIAATVQASWGASGWWQAAVTTAQQQRLGKAQTTSGVNQFVPDTYPARSSRFHLQWLETGSSETTPAPKATGLN